jgi:hypothetical protein
MEPRITTWAPPMASKWSAPLKIPSTASPLASALLPARPDGRRRVAPRAVVDRMSPELAGLNRADEATLGDESGTAGQTGRELQRSR